MVLCEAGAKRGCYGTLPAQVSPTRSGGSRACARLIERAGASTGLSRQARADHHAFGAGRLPGRTVANRRRPPVADVGAPGLTHRLPTRSEALQVSRTTSIFLAH